MNYSEAKRRGEVFYDGAICKHGHEGGLRYVNNRSCVTCTQIRNEQNHRQKRSMNMPGIKRTPEERESIIASVTKLQQQYADHGESDIFLSMTHKERARFGFSSSKEYTNMISSFMKGERIDGRYRDFIRGLIPSARYIGTNARMLLSQRWDGGLRL